VPPARRFRKARAASEEAAGRKGRRGCHRGYSKSSPLPSPHEASDRNTGKSAIGIAKVTVKGDILPALRFERRSRGVFSIAFRPKAVYARTQQHLCHGRVTGRVRGGSS
jgi:hypothetical protein